MTLTIAPRRASVARILRPAKNVLSRHLALCRASFYGVWQKVSPRSATPKLPEGGNARRFFRYDASIVLVRGAGRLTLEQDQWT